MENLTTTIEPYSIALTAYTFKIIAAIIIFIVGRFVAKVLTSIFKKFLAKSTTNETLEVFLGNAIYGLLLVIVVLATLNQLGVQTTSFIAILGAVGLAIGLAFQSTLSNISAGVMIIIFKPLQIGDLVEAGGVFGTVEDINLFNTILKTNDNKVIIVSNSNIVNNNITNYSKKETRRVDFVFGIGYDDDLKLAKQTLLDITNADSRVLKDPAAFVAVSELGDSSVNFVVRVWVKSEDYWGVHFDTIEKVKLTFDEKGISIPYPQMDIHTDK